MASVLIMPLNPAATRISSSPGSYDFRRPPGRFQCTRLPRTTCQDRFIYNLTGNVARPRQWRERGSTDSGGHGRLGEQRESGRRVAAGLKETSLTEQKWGPAVSLGTAQLPQDVDLYKLENLLYQWGSNLTQNSNLPLPVPLKVDRVEGGVRLGFIKVTDGKVEDLVHIDVIISPPSGGELNGMFRAMRNGQLKNVVPPGEPLIMQSLLAALKKSVALSRS